MKLLTIAAYLLFTATASAQFGVLVFASKPYTTNGVHLTVTYVGDKTGKAWVPDGGGLPHYKATVTVRDGTNVVGIPMDGTFCAEDDAATEPGRYVAQAFSNMLYAATIVPYLFPAAAITNGALPDAWDAGDSFRFRDGLQVREVPRLSTNWVRLWGDGDVEHQCGVVTGNWCAELCYGGCTNLWPLTTNVLTLKEPPQRTVTNQPPQQQWQWQWQFTNSIFTNQLFIVPCYGGAP